MTGIRTGRVRLLGAIVLAGAVAACQTAKPSRGPWFAQDYTCAHCHGVERGSASPDPEAPTFAAIVNREGVTADTLTASFSHAHARIDPDIMVIPQPMMDELVAYMLSLQDPKYRSR